MLGEATFVIQLPFLLAAFVHDPTLHIADCACGYVGDVRITKLKGMESKSSTQNSILTPPPEQEV